MLRFLALADRDIKALTLRALSDLSSAELTKDTTLITIIRRWPGAWETDLAARMVEAFAAHFRITAGGRTANNLLREVFLRLAPDLANVASEQLGDLDDLGVWRNTAVEFLRTLRFRRDILATLAAKPPRS